MLFGKEVVEMVKFDGRILQFGFGAVGKSFFEKLKYEVDYDEY